MYVDATAVLGKGQAQHNPRKPSVALENSIGQ